jgi:hypothetical protein
MLSRRDFLRGGLGAFALGLGARAGIGKLLPIPGAGIVSERLRWAQSQPFRLLPLEPDSIIVDGLPFAPGFTGDGFDNDQIPFHHVTDWFKGGPPPEAEETIRVVVVGGGISGLATAYLLRDLNPVLFELRDRFGGNALGEVWGGIPFSLGSAYVIVPDKGSFLESFYKELGLDRVARISRPPDPVAIHGQIREDFWSGKLLTEKERKAFERYAEVVKFFAEKAYPEIPLSDDPEKALSVKTLDTRSFRADVEDRMGMPMTPFLAAGVQGYFYSAFGAGMEDISAAGGWNFVAAEEFGRWVFPGGNGYLATTMWSRLRDRGFAAGQFQQGLRSRCQVIDVRMAGDHVQVSYFDPSRTLRSLLADFLVMAGGKPVCKHVLYNLAEWDRDKYEAFHQIWTAAYVVVNVLLDAPIQRDFYDCFLLGDERFPMDGSAVEANPRVTDMLRGDYASRRDGPRSVLTLYWPLIWPAARFTLLLHDPWRQYAERLAPQLREMLRLLEIPDSAVRQIRMTRWGHAVPLARPRLIVDGVIEQVRRPLNDRIFFVNQDNWALPAVENSLLEARSVASTILARS